MSDSETENLPLETEKAAATAVASFLPDKSRTMYKQFYKRFTDWCASKNIKFEAKEKVLLAFFEELSKKYKSSSHWAFYAAHGDQEFNNLIAFLKKQSVGYKPKKSRIFTKEDVSKFLQDADDTKFLLTKVALIIGLGGGCRVDELTNLLSMPNKCCNEAL